MFPGPSADAWDEACVTLTYRGPSPGQARMGATGATWKEEIDDLVKGGERMQMMSWIFWILNTFWTALDFFVICNLCKLYAAIAARVIGYDVPWCAMKIIINHEHQDVFFFNRCFFQTRRRPWLSPLAAVLLMSRLSFGAWSHSSPRICPWQLQHPETDRNRNTTAVSLLSHCQLSVTCWSLAGHLLVTSKVHSKSLTRLWFCEKKKALRWYNSVLQSWHAEFSWPFTLSGWWFGTFFMNSLNECSLLFVKLWV